jgi:hypothetical protein
MSAQAREGAMTTEQNIRELEVAIDNIRAAMAKAISEGDRGTHNVLARRYRVLLARLDEAREGAMTTEQIDGHGPSSLSGKIEGYIQHTPADPDATFIVVPYWSVVNWQGETASLEKRVLELLADTDTLRPLYAAALRYGRAIEASNAPGMSHQQAHASDVELVAAHRGLHALALALVAAE